MQQRINNGRMVEVKMFMSFMFVMFVGPLRQLWPVNKAGRPPSDWDATQQWPLTESHCQGISHQDQALLMTHSDSI